MSFFPLNIRLSFNLFISLKQDLAPLLFLVSFYPQIVHFFLAQFVPSTRVTTNNHTTESILGCFEISSVNGINPKLILTSCSFFGGDKSKKQSYSSLYTNIFLLWNLLNQAPTIQITLGNNVFHVPSRMAH